MKLNIKWAPKWDLSQLKEFDILWFKTQNNYEIKLVIYKYNIYLEGNYYYEKLY